MARTLSLIVLVSLASCIESEGQRPRSDATTADDTSEPTTEPTTTTEPDTSVEPDVRPDEPCDHVGTERCNGSAIEVCGDELVWESTRCGEGNVCVSFDSAQCVPADQTCRQVLYCMFACGTLEDPALRGACGEQCMARGTDAAALYFDQLQDCLDDRDCDEDGENDPLKPLKCMRYECTNELGRCFFDARGEDSCGSIFACQQGCAETEDYETCRQTCGSTAAFEVQAEYAVLEMCLLFMCADAPDGDACFAENVTGGPCKTLAPDCTAEISGD